MSKLPLVYELIIRRHLPNKRLKVLDVGCGTGIAGEVFNSDKKHEFIGVDIYEPYLEKCRDSEYYSKCTKMDLATYRSGDGKYDVALILQVIEHLTLKEAKSLLSELEKDVKGKIILSVPNGECRQEEYDENPYQRHKSEWDPRKLRDLGFAVYGQGLGLIFQDSSYGGAKRKPAVWQRVLFIISFLLSPITYFYPRWAAQLIGVKYTKNEKQ